MTMNSHAPDPFMHGGRHFGRVSHTFCNIRSLITNGLIRMSADEPLSENARYVGVFQGSTSNHVNIF